MRIFISAGEPSGDLHGANLVGALRHLHPGIDCVGFGGERMQAAGCRLLYPLCQLAVMWFLRVLTNAPIFLQLLSRADRYFRHHRPDAVVLIDYPGFHWWLARRAHFHGIPVFYFVPPQLWGWAGWRVKKMRRWVDHVLCSLPFEEDWYRQRGVTAHHVGHPYFDELAGQSFDADFLSARSAWPGKTIALLPGSRTQEVDRNLGTLVRSAALVHQARPDTRFLVACYRDAHRQQVESYLRKRASMLPIEVHAGRTAEIIRLADACIAVSGSVSLELLYHCKPTVVVYRISSWDMQLCRLLKTSRYICLVNLLADAELFPEFLTIDCPASAISGHILRWLNDPSAHQDVRTKMQALVQQVAMPGACERAARYVLDALAGKTMHAA